MPHGPARRPGPGDARDDRLRRHRRSWRGSACPTLVVVGDKDTTTLPEAGQFIASNVPGAKLATLSPARHMGLIEHHGRFDQLVADFADTCQSAGVTR